MKATYRRKVRNGLVTRRSLEVPRPSRGGWVASQSPAVWVVVIGAAIIASGFVASLRWQHMAQQLNRDEVRLRTRLDQVQTEQKYLKLERVGALSPGRIESQLPGKASFAPLTLDDPSAVISMQSRLRAEELQEKQRAQDLARQERERALKEREKPAGVKSSVEKKDKPTTDASVLIDSQ